MTQSPLFAEPDAAATVSVLVPYPVDRAYSYSVPADLRLRPGDYVTVPLGKRDVPGVVWDPPEIPEKIAAHKLKAVAVRHDMPAMPAVQRRFLDWVAHYNMASPGFVLKMALSVPAALEPSPPTTGYILSDIVLKALSPAGRGWGEGAGYQPKPEPQLRDNALALRHNQTEAEKKLWFALNDRQLGDKFRRQHPIDSYILDFVCLEKNLVIELDGGQHADQVGYDEKRTKILQAKGFRILRFWNNEVMDNFAGVLETIAGALSAPSPRPSPQGAREKFLNNLSPQRQRVLTVMADGLPRRAGEIAEMAGCTPAVVKGMAAANLLRAIDLFSPAPCSHPDVTRAGVPLSAAQDAMARQMMKFVDDGAYHASLLDGVTGAGKTEVYFEAVAAALRKGRQALILLPEIALSNAFLDRFRARFGCAPALWHSALTPAQRRNTWRGVAESHTKVVVGARSALFLPYADLGLIVVDEEHDPAYKQEDGVIYNARDMAVVRAHLGKIPIVLVSATPSLETISNVWSGRYTHLHLPDRHGGAQLPDIHVIDMRVDKPERQKFIAPPLLKAVADNLAQGGQSLLFLNRRGYAPLTLCRTCGHRFNCPRCTAWLVEHKKQGRLQCHHCGYSLPAPKQCPQCHDADSLTACGPGVERVLEEVREHFPDARTVILASDTAGSNEELRGLLADIRDHKYDIIVGTQIIAKGHHFPKLTLVGVIDADLGLQGGDLRVAERTFQLLHQVAGRAGREDLPGHVWLQTFIPGNKVMQALSHHERDAFLEAESQEREAAHMPPFTRLAGIIVSGKDEKLVMDCAQALAQVAPQGPGLQTLGPAEAPFYRLRGNFRRRLLVRADKTLNLQKAIEAWLAQVKVPSMVRVSVDIDPQSFL